MSEPLTIATPTDTELVVTRSFDAPRELVFDAWTRTEHVPSWLLGPDGWSMPVCEIDLRPGGAWRYVWRNDADGHEFGMHGVFREVVRPERIVHTEIFEDAETLNTVVFDDEDDRTTVTMTVVYPSKEIRDAALATGMTDGMERSFERLEERFAATR